MHIQTFVFLSNVTNVCPDVDWTRVESNFIMDQTKRIPSLLTTCSMHSESDAQLSITRQTFTSILSWPVSCNNLITGTKPSATLRAILLRPIFVHSAKDATVLAITCLANREKIRVNNKTLQFSRQTRIH